jgi:hypothetical protein
MVTLNVRRTTISYALISVLLPWGNKSKEHRFVWRYLQYPALKKRGIQCPKLEEVIQKIVSHKPTSKFDEFSI